MHKHRSRASPAGWVIAREMVAEGADRVRSRYRLNRRETESLLFFFCPSLRRDVFANTVSPQDRSEFELFLQDVNAVNAVNTRGGELLLKSAREPLTRIFLDGKFAESVCAGQIADRCLAEWTRHRDAMTRSGRNPILSKYSTRRSELIEILSLLVKMAAVAPSDVHRSGLPKLKQIYGQLLLSAKRTQEAESAFSDAAATAEAFGSEVQTRYIRLFRSIAALRNSWQQLDFAAARRWLSDAVALADTLDDTAFPRGFYWSREDLRRDRYLIDATEHAFAGRAAEAMSLLDIWQAESDDLRHTSPQYPRVRVQKLTLDYFLAGNLTLRGRARAALRNELKAHTWRADVFCFELVNAPGLSVDDATRLIARVMPRDSDVPPEYAERVRERVEELKYDRDGTWFFPPWISEWVMDDVPDRRTYAVLVAALVTVEFYSALLAWPSPTAFDGVASVRDRLVQISNAPVRDAEVLRRIIELLTEIINTGVPPPPLRAHEALCDLRDVWPHIVRCVTVQPTGRGATVTFDRCFSLGPPTLTTSAPAEGWEYSQHYYLYPWLTQFRGNVLQRDPREKIGGHHAKLYGEPLSGSCTLIVEGDTEIGLFSTLLDTLFPLWRAFDLRLEQAFGDSYLKTVQAVVNSGSAIICVYDADKTSQFATNLTQPVWAETVTMIAISPHFTMTPDVEAAAGTAVLNAIAKLNPEIGIDLPAANALYRDRTWKRGWRPFARALTAARVCVSDKLARSQLNASKGRRFGEVLARELLSESPLRPDFRRVVLAVERTVRGLRA